MNHNPNPTSYLPWCDPQNQEAITRTILENTRTQFQFRTDRPTKIQADVLRTKRLRNSADQLTNN